eukprot:CAMPEP_0169128214 /NCGR_PEP_ID=MMETSP1015-20121227/36439_1 /TAXON_ID=342587 /ORGANISM="Karlodinium micrum, Strain CCMP2283" /LENGTH=282 /DNA_ID=CAMNT_0009192083 /DNA_START=17 /DNA_END=865 /DNA_ORIENTATION=+
MSPSSRPNSDLDTNRSCCNTTEVITHTIVPCSPLPASGFILESFKNFAPLLEASQDYASQTGFRFRESSFDGLDDITKTCAKMVVAGGRIGEMSVTQDASESLHLAAKINAVPAMKCFSERLSNSDPPLIEELEKAFRIVVAESARSMMIATVKGLGIFPPKPAPDGIDDDDCSYEDVSAPLPVIAQRLFNDEARRFRDEAGSAERLQRRAMTAAFLVDFAYFSGVTLPEPAETYQSLLQEFSARNLEFSEQEDAQRCAAAEIKAAQRATKLKLQQLKHACA